MKGTVNNNKQYPGTEYVEQLDQAVRFLHNHIDTIPKIVLVCGSGLGDLANDLQNPISISYTDIPHFPTSTVSGHAGNLVFGTLADKPVVFMEGRVHLYEGYTGPQVAFPLRTLGMLGSEIALITNSAGGLNRDFKHGDLMLVTNHIGMFSADPTISVYHPRLGELFYDVSEPYDKELCEIARKAYQELEIPLLEGNYILYPNCSYETKAEIEYMARMGADAVGKSTVPEVLAACQLGMRVLGISCISTNMVLDPEESTITHKEIVEVGKRSAERFCKLIKEIVSKI